MAKEIIWTPQSEKTYEAVINYLQENWSEKEIERFVEETNKIIESIALHPEMYRRLTKINVREALITKHNLLLYSISQDHIDLISFWDTRQNPKKKIRLLRK